MQVTHERGESTGPEVDPDEPQQLGHHHEGVAGEQPDVTGPGGETRQVCDDAEDDPDDEECEGGSQQPRGTRAKERGIPPWGCWEPSLERLESVRVGHAADEEEERHDLEQPGQRLEGRHHGERVRDLPVGGDGDHEPVPEDHDEERANPEGVDPAVALRRRRSVELGRGARHVGSGPHGLGSSTGLAHNPSKHGRRPEQMSSPAQAVVRSSCCGPAPRGRAVRELRRGAGSAARRRRHLPRGARPGRVSRGAR